ncbi:hypothetical protein AYO45_01415 [Gammaproteobacteria bacterium SCGC AG-212-F23]|nr:hypothetical protein AYO45_01415 [Gammaproteobacteria bacterium SCGC AG-212-F23]
MARYECHFSEEYWHFTLWIVGSWRNTLFVVFTWMGAAMTKEEILILMYNQYFQTMRDYLVHIQSLILLLVTACAYIFFKSQTKPIKYLSGVMFLVGVINLVIGFVAYSNLLSTILDLRLSPSKADLMAIGCYVWVQFIIGLIVLFSVMYCAVAGRYAK